MKNGPKVVLGREHLMYFHFDWLVKMYLIKCLVLLSCCFVWTSQFPGIAKSQNIVESSPIPLLRLANIPTYEGENIQELRNANQDTQKILNDMQNVSVEIGNIEVRDLENLFSQPESENPLFLKIYQSLQRIVRIGWNG